MAVQFTDANLHRFEVRGELLGWNQPHVLIERLTVKGQHRQRVLPFGIDPVLLVLDRAAVEALIDALRNQLDAVSTFTATEVT